MSEQRAGWRRRLLNTAAALLMVAGLLATTGVALAQRSSRFGLGCWAIATAGATGGAYQSANYRMQYAVTHVGPTDSQARPSSQNIRLIGNHFAARRLLLPRVAGAPPAGPRFQYLPLAWGRVLNLNGLNSCR